MFFASCSRFCSGQSRRLILNKLLFTSFYNTSNKFCTKMPETFPVIKFRRVSENAFAPKKGSQFAAGYDLCSAYEYSIKPMDKQLVSTDLEIALPNGYYGRVAPRSGLALKEFIDVGGGVIDQDYRGTVGVILFNFGQKEFKVNKGDRIAQLICEKICYPDVMEVEHLDKTDRGDGGFGSSGIN